MATDGCLIPVTANDYGGRFRLQGAESYGRLIVQLPGSGSNLIHGIAQRTLSAFLNGEHAQ
jgi:hypothetical protein